MLYNSKIEPYSIGYCTVGCVCYGYMMRYEINPNRSMKRS